MPTEQPSEDKYAALLTVTEVGLGSLLHAFHLPLSGQFLSLNQGVLLTFAAKNSSNRPARISFLASLLKSLSPAGKRLTPMLAITAQGLLFSLGLLVGRNALGIALGMALLSVWAFAQPLLLAHLIFGQALWDAIAKLWGEISAHLSLPLEWGVRFLIAVVAGKGVLAVGLGLTAWWSGTETESRYSQAMRSLPHLPRRERATVPAWRGALRDLSSPWFLLSLVFSGIYFWMEGKEVWIYLLRPLAVGYLVFWAIRSFPLRNFSSLQTVWDQAFRSRS